ncbi:MAG: hypothetical protein N2116_06650 [Armatimonadetes bacterium]|nr:hypothetical protein [Armatimonadota bacterium]
MGEGRVNEILLVSLLVALGIKFSRPSWGDRNGQITREQPCFEVWRDLAMGVGIKGFANFTFIALFVAGFVFPVQLFKSHFAFFLLDELFSPQPPRNLAGDKGVRALICNLTLSPTWGLAATG